MINLVCECVLCLPKVLYSGVLHDGARSEAEGVRQGVSWWGGWSPLILLGLCVLSTHPLPTESLNTRLYLTGREADITMHIHGL